MKDPRLDDFLKKLSVPEPDPAARSRALSRARAAFENREAIALVEEERAWGWLGPVGFALALLIAVFFLPFSLSTEPSPSFADRVMLDEMTALFHQRLTAVVERGGEVDVQTSLQDMPSSEQPVRILFRRGREVVRVLSFSGREVCLDLDGKRVCFDVLATKDDNVILMGGDFLWDRDHSVSLAGYRIEAVTLLPAS